MTEQLSPATQRHYSLSLICRVWKIQRSSVYAQLSTKKTASLKRRGPMGAKDDQGLIADIKAVLSQAQFVSEGYRKAWARLRAQGINTSKERVRRLMREAHLQAPRRPQTARGDRAHNGTICTTSPDSMWGTDATSIMTAEGTATVFIMVDHCTRECLGLHAARRATRFEALEVVRQAIRHSFGEFKPMIAQNKLAIRHDHGSQFISATYQDELKFLGIRSTPSFVAEPQCNGVSERFIRTLKEQLLWLRRFDSVEQVNNALAQFKAHYNQTWLVAKHGYITPSQARIQLISPSSSQPS